jgi:cobalt-zinc-cadmium efflux system membrane fusion protein
MTNITLYTLFFALLLSSCGQGEGNTTENTPPQVENKSVILNEQQIKNLGVQVGQAQLDTLQGEIAAQGKIAVPPQQHHIISFPVSAKVAQVLVAPGSQVKQGQTIATIEDLMLIQVQQDYLDAKWDRIQKEGEYQRQQELYKQKAISDKAFKETETLYQKSLNAERGQAGRLSVLGIAMPKQAQDIQNQVALKAPCSGVLSELNLLPGAYITPGQPLAKVMNTEKLWVDISVFGQHDVIWKVGDRVDIQDMNGYRTQGNVMSWENQLSSTDQARHVFVQLDHPNGDWLPGVSVQTLIHGQPKPAFSIPKESVVIWENQPHVFISQDGKKFTLTPTQGGTEQLGRYFLPESFTPSQGIATQGAYYLLMSLKNVSED